VSVRIQREDFDIRAEIARVLPDDDRRRLT